MNEPVNIVEFKVGVPETYDGPNAVKVILKFYDPIKAFENVHQPTDLDKEAIPDKVEHFYLTADQAKSFGQQLLVAAKLLEIDNE